jgi:hypothetical protein
LLDDKIPDGYTGDNSGFGLKKSVFYHGINLLDLLNEAEPEHPDDIMKKRILTNVAGAFGAVNKFHKLPKLLQN